MVFDLGSFFGKKDLPLIGLDISTTTIKIVELSGTPERMRVESCTSEPLPRDAVIDGNIDNHELVAEVIRRAWKKSGTRIKRVALALPTAAVITKKISLPSSLTEEELEVQVESEANQYIPFALDEVSLDFCVMGSSAHGAEDVDVLLAAARREKVEDRVAAVEAAGLEAVVMDLESFCGRSVIERLTYQLPNNAKGQLIALFQIGANVTNISIMLDGQAVYEREQPLGGNQLTQDIMRTYGLSFEEAEARKKANDLPAGFQKELLEPYVENMALEIARTIQFFFTSTPYTKLDHILLGGAGAILPGLANVVMSRTQVQTSLVNPFKGMEVSPRIREKQLSTEAVGYVVACGLAMRRFD